MDVGDGRFIPPITMGPIVLQSIAALVHDAGGVLDCHLMVETPERHLPQFKEAGADSVTVHFETCPNLAGTVAIAREHRLRSGWPSIRTRRREAAAAALERRSTWCSA